MSVKQSHYEILLAEYSSREAAIALLRQHRPYLEMIPSLRRPHESVITLPLPIARIRNSRMMGDKHLSIPPSPETVRLPCDLAVLMCDPEWKIKMGSEILVFIHRPEEDFSDLLSRWRNTEVYLDHEYEWLMPACYQDMFSEGSDQIYPLFIVFEETLDRIKKGLAGANLPFLIQSTQMKPEQETVETISSET
jgi:hypothetical protein